MGRPFESWSVLIDPFERHRAQAYARLCRAALKDPQWSDCDAPLAALHAVRMASFEGRATDPFLGDTDAFIADLDNLADEVRTAVQRGLVQFTEPLRVADVVPGLLLASRWAGERPLRLVELGSSMGLLLAAEQFRIRYPNALWDPPNAVAELVSDLDVPASLLAEPLNIVERIGVDLSPVDPQDPRTYDHLRAFAWPGDPLREDRLRVAVDALAAAPPPILTADAIHVLPDLVPADRDTVTVVIESALSPYLSGPQAYRLGRMLDAFAARTHLMFLTRAAHPEEAVLTSNMTLIDLTRRQRQIYSLADMLCERTRWVGPQS